MKVYTFPKSRSLRVLWTLEELKLGYETCPVELFSPQHKFLLPEDARSPAVIDATFKDAQKALAAVRIAPDSSWIAGEHFTLADIFLCHTLMWAQLCGLRLNEAVNNYVQRCQQRKTYGKALERNNRTA